MSQETNETAVQPAVVAEEPSQKKATKPPLYLMRHPHTGDTQGVNTQEELIPLMMRGYQQVKA